MNRRGEYLHDASKVPFVWLEREMMATAFRSRADAQAFIARHLVSEEAARELAGVRIE